ncbi:MAG: DEAD/DEAH box helicase family protein, partial [Lachnospiraceae bacterium]|nr:DEAD/DEAH box helicase family protein [Lachnospiraceae bacterium]
SEFNTLIEELSHEWFDGKEKLIKKYGSIEKAMDNGDYSYVGYAKTAIRIDVPGFKEIDTRIDIGDFNTDLLGYLSNYSEYDEQVKVLKNYLSNNIVNKKDENVLNENIELLVAATKINNDIELLEADEIIEADEFDTPDKVVFEQMSLFDFAMSEAEQIGDIISAEATKPQINASSIFVSDELVKDIVASGANYEARYAIFYRITRPFDTREKMVDFVKQQYKGSIKGIILENGDKIALYADEDGLKISHVTRARVKPERVVIYEEILDIATELVKEGKFISSTELPYAEEMELSHLAEDIVDIFWSSEAKNYFNDYFNEYRFGYPDLKDKIKESLINADDNLISLGDSLKKLYDDHTNGVIELPWYKVNHYNNEYGNIFDRIALYNSEPIKYQLNDDLEVYKEAFITHDFIDKHITYSGVENGEFRIRKYFGENFTNIQEAAKYLAEEYGTSGRGVPGGNGYSLERRPGKGITISKGMVGQRDVEVKLKYTEVAKILKYLVENDMFFFTEEEKNAYKEWREYIYDKGIEKKDIITPRTEGTLRYEEEQKRKTQNGEIDEDDENDEIEADIEDDQQDEIIEEQERFEDIIQPLNVWNYVSGDESLKIEQIDENKYINYYGNSSAGVFNSFEEAENMLFRHRPNAKPILSQNYKYDLDNLVVRESFAPRSRFRDNIEAIKLLKKLEKENRNATTDEQEILAKYVGWGGMQNAFEANNDRWSSEYKELRALLNDEEYNAAMSSVLTSFYTSPEVVKAIYKALGNMEFTEGTLLEPSCGVGNFFGCLPQELDGKVKLHGVELDSLSGRIAQKLYPNADIQIAPYEKSNTKNNYYDVAVGNVPFGDYKVYDPLEKKWNFAIHNYFFANTIKKVREGGVIAFITSSFTMDSKSSAFREYMAERAEFLGAIRLPNNAFKGVAGTEVVSDIIFFKKRDVPTVDISNEPFIHVGKCMGHSINEYFIENPDMVLGEIKEVSGRFGNVLTVVDNGKNLGKQLETAVDKLYEYKIKPIEDIKKETEKNLEDEAEVLPANPEIMNMSYGIIKGKIYFRKNDVMIEEKDLSEKNKERLKGLIDIKDTLNELISLQLLVPSDEINEQIDITRMALNELYDSFVQKNGYINNRANASLIEADVNRYKLLSLERAIEDSKEFDKADIFVKRTVSPVVEIKSCDTAVEGLAVSLTQKGDVNIPYICELCNITEEECLNELEGHIYFEPVEQRYVTADEYLSGNIAFKIDRAIRYGDVDKKHDYRKNIEALEKVMPERIKAEDISVRLGSNWIPTDMYHSFIHELLESGAYYSGKITIGYVDNTAEYFIVNKTWDSNRVQVRTTYGTKRKTAYEIIEDSLNLRDTKVYDVVEDDYGKEKSVLNLKETIDAQAKQDIIKEKFVEWLWADPKRVERVENIYNERFNTTRNREFDGSFLTLPGSNPAIKLKEHQLNAVARIVYGGNTLLAHVVGAGKTFEMIAAAMESKRLGLCNKPLFVVPKHLTVQWGTEFMTLYPTANILVAKETDFTPENRKKFCTRIAMGDYDAIIIGHSQFEKIPIYFAYEKSFIEKEISLIDKEINQLVEKAGRYLNDTQKMTKKKLESEKKRVQARLERLTDRADKDDVITFEELGVDRLFVDEAHYYKNLYTRTKMSNIAGIPTTESRKSMDMYMKCQYLNEMTDEKGVIFATGTPVSNTMVEMYTLQRYLAPSELMHKKISNFDAWASTFGNTVTAMELAPEGTGYRMKTRFSKFYNLPELVSMFKQFADVKTADMLELDVPKALYHNITIDSSDFQKEKLLELADRAEDVRNGRVQPSEDNMLKITTDGRKLALDQRILSPLMDESEHSKTKAVVENAMKLYRQYNDDKAVQVIFCDMSTPSATNTKKVKAAEDDILTETEFKNVYEDIKEKLIVEGVPEKEIAFIHNANTDKRKAELFAKCRAGDVRFLLGSTFKLGAGTNIQNRLIGLHHVDVPWRPSDIEQQEGRIIRQGNMYDEVNIFRYVTEGTFDAYSWQIIENKQKFISQIMTSKSPVRVAD